MKLRYFFSISILAASAFVAACGGTAETPANNGNAVSAKNANVNGGNSTSQVNSVAVTTPTPDPNQATNNAPTLTPVYKAYCAAVVKKDDAALRKVWTSDSIQFFETQMKADGIKSLSEYMDPVTNEVCEVANERFKGDKAVARVKTVSYPSGFDVLFVKEGGEWKMSNISPEKGFQ